MIDLPDDFRDLLIALADGGATHGLDRDTRRDEGFHVAVDRPHRDLEMRGELRRRELPSHLQEEEQRNEPRRPHRA